MSVADFKSNTELHSRQATMQWPQYLSGLSASSGAFIFGMILGWYEGCNLLNVIVNSLKLNVICDLNRPAPAGLRTRQEFDLSPIQWDWIGSIMTIGTGVSCLPIGYMMRTMGRKWAMLSLYIPFTLGWIFLATAKGFWMLFIGRFFLGLAGGAFCISAPLYSAEIAEKEIRGVIGTFFKINLNSGILFIYVIGPYIRDVMWINIVCGLITIALGAIFLFMPESPVFLVIDGRKIDAEKSYKWLRGAQYDPQHEIDELTFELEEKARNRIDFKEAFKMRATKMAIFIGFGLVTFQQMSGFNVVIFYSTDIFRAAEIDIDPDYSAMIIASINLASTCIGALLVDRLGRRILLMTSIVGMTIFTTSLSAYFFVFPKPVDTNTLEWTAVMSMGLYLMFFALGYGPITWLMIGEVYSKQVSEVLGSLNGSYNGFVTFAITFSFGNINRAIGMAWSFALMASFSFVGIFFTYFIVPETKGKSMLEIQTMLNKDSRRHENTKL